MQEISAVEERVAELFSECREKISGKSSAGHFAKEIIWNTFSNFEKSLNLFEGDERKAALFAAAKELDQLRNKFRELKTEEVDEGKKEVITFINEKLIVLIALLIREEKDWQLVKRIDQMITPVYYFDKEKTEGQAIPFAPSAKIDQEYIEKVFSKRFENVKNERPDLGNEIEEYKGFLERTAPKIEQ